MEDPGRLDHRLESLQEENKRTLPPVTQVVFGGTHLQWIPRRHIIFLPMLLCLLRWYKMVPAGDNAVTVMLRGEAVDLEGDSSKACLITVSVVIFLKPVKLTRGFHLYCFVQASELTLSF